MFELFKPYNLGVIDEQLTKVLPYYVTLMCNSRSLCKLFLPGKLAVSFIQDGKNMNYFKSKLFLSLNLIF